MNGNVFEPVMAQGIVDMTEEEKRLFRGFVIREERLESGMLTAVERKRLLVLRMMCSELARKYPSRKLEYLVYSPADALQRSPELLFRDTGSDAVCSAVLFGELSEPDIRDNLWGTLVSREAAELVRQKIGSGSVTAKIPSVTGCWAGETCSFGMSRNRQCEVFPHYEIVLRPEELLKCSAETIRSRMSEEKMQGSYRIHVLEPVSGHTLLCDSFIIPVES